MKASELNCPQCGAGLSFHGRPASVSCVHCRSTVPLSWPAPPHTDIVKDPIGPVMFCPDCSAQVLRTGLTAGQLLACSDCGGEAVIPAVSDVSNRPTVCGVCGRVYLGFHDGCPDCERGSREANLTLR